MKRIAPVISILVCCLASTVHAQRKVPRLLNGAVHCLAIQNFLPSSPASKRTFGYFLDEKSYPGDKVIYVVNYAAPTRSNGWVFVVFLTQRDGHQHFNIQNNASFVLSKRHFDYDGVKFLSPPLGGDWTQLHIAMAIRRIETELRFTLGKKGYLAAMASVTCESYTDNLRPRD